MDHIYLQVMKNSNVRDIPSGSSAMQPCSWSNLLSLFIYSVCTVALISSPVVDATGLFYYFFIDSQREIKKAPRFLCLEDDGLSLSRKFLASKDWPRLGAVSGKFLWSQLLGLVTWEFFTVNKADLLGVVTRMTPTIPLDDSSWQILLTIPTHHSSWRFLLLLLGAVIRPRLGAVVLRCLGRVFSTPRRRHHLGRTRKVADQSYTLITVLVR